MTDYGKISLADRVAKLWEQHGWSPETRPTQNDVEAWCHGFEGTSEDDTLRLYLDTNYKPGKTQLMFLGPNRALRTTCEEADAFMNGYISKAELLAKVQDRARSEEPEVKVERGTER
jgi:hypothetical protein